MIFLFVKIILYIFFNNILPRNLKYLNYQIKISAKVYMRFKKNKINDHLVAIYLNT